VLIRKYAGELVTLSPELIVAAGGPQASAVHAVSQTIPVVFAQSIDPVGAGLVKSLARPGGNSTGFMQFEYGLSGKWPQLLKEIAPHTKRAAVLRDPSNPAGIGQWAVLQAMAPAVDMELTPISLLDVDEVKQGITAMANSSGGLIVPVSARAVLNRQTIVAQAAANRLPAVYPYRSFVVEGGLLSYGPDLIAQYKRAASYVDRILRGEKPADLPVQAPTKYELVLNVKTAKALGLDVPPTLLARADEVIE
jgi:putative tryptophan/tyrosine transport system substrate-binding protein